MNKKFIEQAKSIRREYIKNINDVAKCEEKINIYKKELTKIQENLSSIDQDSLRIKMMDIEKNLKYIENIMEPFTKKVKKLEKDADILFENIKECHPNLSTEDIKNELVVHLKEIKF